MKIALIDDSKFNIKEFEQVVLEIEELDVKTYQSREDFLKNYLERKEKFDIVFLDGTMPGVTAEEFFDKVKGNKSNQIIIMYGDVPFEYIQYFVDLGADGFIRKPLDVEQLKEKIEKYKK